MCEEENSEEYWAAVAVALRRERRWRTKTKTMLQPTHTLNFLSQLVDSIKYSAHSLENTKPKNTDSANSNFALGTPLLFGKFSDRPMFRVVSSHFAGASNVSAESSCVLWNLMKVARYD